MLARFTRFTGRDHSCGIPQEPALAVLYYSLSTMSRFLV